MNVTSIVKRGIYPSTGFLRGSPTPLLGNFQLLSVAYLLSVLFQETCAQLFAALELTFSIDLSPEEGGGVPNTSVELVSRGRDLEVNSHNVYTYVRKYSQYR